MVIAQRNDSEAQKGVVTVPYGKRSVVGTTWDTSSKVRTESITSN
jgi:hypothetical protein